MSDGVLEGFCRDGAPRTLLVAAHPDDETLGAGAHLPGARDLFILHITDGAPRDLADARRCGFGSRDEYAHARHSELAEAMELAGVAGRRLLSLGIPDQEAALHLCRIAAEVRDLLRRLQPELVLTHPYEGGHPDHDACAVAVRAAARGLPAVVAEFASYHAAGQGTMQFDFLPAAGAAELVIGLDERRREFKRRMLACFATQRETLAQFPLGAERFRPAPVYDFSRPPHPGRLHYERYPWGMTGERFRRLALEAAAGC